MAIKEKDCMFVLYPETQEEAIQIAQKNFPCAWALHDRDTWHQRDVDAWNKRHSDLPFPYEVGSLKKPHVHFVVHFKNPRHFTAIAKELGVPVNTINRCNNLLKAFEYLTHDNDPDKYQYDSEIVGMNDFEVPRPGSSSDNEEERQVCLLLDMPAFATTSECARWAYENGCWASFRKAYGIWRDIRNEARSMASADPSFSTSQQNPLAKDFADPFRPSAKDSPWD